MFGLKCVNLRFEFPDAVQYLLERWLVSEDHVLHVPIVVGQNLDGMFRRHQLNLSACCPFVMRPRATVELALERHDFVKEIRIPEG